MTKPGRRSSTYDPADRHEREVDEADRQETHAGHQHRLHAEPRHEPLRDRRGHDHRQRDREIAEAGSQRAVPEHLLHVERAGRTSRRSPCRERSRSGSRPSGCGGRKIESGTSGERERSSRTMKIAIRIAEASSTPICAEAQPTRFACVSPRREASGSPSPSRRPRRRSGAAHPQPGSRARNAWNEEERDDRDRDVDEEAPLPAMLGETPPISTPIAAPEPAIAPSEDPERLVPLAPSAKVTSTIENTEGARMAPATLLRDPRADQHPRADGESRDQRGQRREPRGRP